MVWESVNTGASSDTGKRPHLFGKGYIAYGFKDERVKGLAELEYSFKKKKEYANEFPIHSLKLRYESDVNQYGQNYLYTSKDNVLSAHHLLSEERESGRRTRLSDDVPSVGRRNLSRTRWYRSTRLAGNNRCDRLSRVSGQGIRYLYLCRDSSAHID